MKKVTMDVLAKELGTTKNTVSKALRGASGVGEELRTRILALAEEYGYSKGPLPASASKTPVAITMVWREHHFRDAYFWSNVCSGVLEKASENSISINTVIVEKMKDDIRQLPAFQSSYCQGALMMGDPTPGFLEKLMSMGIPVVGVDCSSDSIDCDFVNTDNKKGIKVAMRHLAEMGHRKIGFVNNKAAVRTYSFQQRFEAFLEGMREMGAPVDKRFIWPDSSYDSNTYLMNQARLLEAIGEAPTAWVCVNDLTGRNLHAVLTECGYRIPEDMSIIGFDNISFPFGPYLTTIDAPQKAIGQRALAQLLHRIENPNEPYESIFLNATLVDRETVRNIKRQDA
jgi:DNA-binding LacI/PurR family transcriptional regulator